MDKVTFQGGGSVGARPSRAGYVLGSGGLHAAPDPDVQGASRPDHKQSS